MKTGSFLIRVSIVVGIILGLLLTWNIRSILIMAFASTVIAIAVSIPMHWLQGKGWPRMAALGGSVAATFLVCSLIVIYILPTLFIGVLELLEELPAAYQTLKTLYTDWWTANPRFQTVFPAPDGYWENIQLDPESVKNSLIWLGETGMALVPSVFGGVGFFAGVLINLGLILLIALFFLLDPGEYVKGSLYLFPEPMHERVLEVWNELYRTIKKWLTVQCFSITVILIGVWVILGVFMGMPKASVVALFAGLATFIPNIGAILPVIPIVIFTLAYGEPHEVLIYVPTYLVIQATESNVITPSFVKSSMSIPAGLLMLFQVVIAMALGALGLILAVPLLATLITLVREVYSYDLLNLRSVSVQLAGDPGGGFQLVPPEPIGATREDPEEALPEDLPGNEGKA